MNNRGQALVIFVLLLPVIFFIMSMVIDFGNFLITKTKAEDEVKDTINYGLKHIEEIDTNTLQTLLDSNVDGKKEITINDKTIKVKINNQVESIFSIIKYEINVSYIGYLDNEKIIIKKE